MNHMNFYNLLGNAIIGILKNIILPVALIIIFIVIVNSIVQYFKYGKKIFDVFKRKNIKNYKDKILFNSLNEATWKKKVLKPNYLKSNYIMIDSNGISLFKLIDVNGTIKGNITDKKLLYKTNNRINSIINPFIELENDETKLKTITKLLITKYLVITDDCNIDIKTSIPLLHFDNILYHLPKGTNDIDIDSIVKKINV